MQIIIGVFIVIAFAGTVWSLYKQAVHNDTIEAPAGAASIRDVEG